MSILRLEGIRINNEERQTIKGAALFKEWKWLQDGTHLPAVGRVKVSPQVLKTSFRLEINLTRAPVEKIDPAVKFIATDRRSTSIRGSC